MREISTADSPDRRGRRPDFFFWLWLAASLAAVFLLRDRFAPLRSGELIVSRLEELNDHAKSLRSYAEIIGFEPSINGLVLGPGTYGRVTWDMPSGRGPSGVRLWFAGRPGLQRTVSCSNDGRTFRALDRGSSFVGELVDLRRCRGGNRVWVRLEATYPPLANGAGTLVLDRFEIVELKRVASITDVPSLFSALALLAAAIAAARTLPGPRIRRMAAIGFAAGVLGLIAVWPAAFETYRGTLGLTWSPLLALATTLLGGAVAFAMLRGDEEGARRLASPALLVIVALGLLSRWFELQASLYEGIRADVENVYKIIGQMRHLYDTSHREPLWIWLGRASVALAGGDRIGLPLFSTFFSVLCIPLVYLFASRYTASRAIGLLAAVFLAANELLIRASGQGHRTELIVACVTLFVFFVFAPNLGKRLRAIGLAVAGTAAALTSIATLAVVLPLGLWTIARFKLGWRGIGILAATLAVFLAPHLAYNVKQFGDPFYFTRQLVPIFYRNYEFMVVKKIQCQGCPTPQELARSSYSGARITMSQYVFGMHTREEVIGRIAEGYARVYLRRSTELAALLGHESADRRAALPLYLSYLAGLAMLLLGRHRELLLLPLLSLNLVAFLVPLRLDPRLLTPPIAFACVAMALPLGWILNRSRFAARRVREWFVTRPNLAAGDRVRASLHRTSTAAFRGWPPRRPGFFLWLWLAASLAAVVLLRDRLAPLRSGEAVVGRVEELDDHGERLRTYADVIGFKPVPGGLALRPGASGRVAWDMRSGPEPRGVKLWFAGGADVRWTVSCSSDGRTFRLLRQGSEFSGALVELSPCSSGDRVWVRLQATYPPARDGPETLVLSRFEILKLKKVASITDFPSLGSALALLAAAIAAARTLPGSRFRRTAAIALAASALGLIALSPAAFETYGGAFGLSGNPLLALATTLLGGALAFALLRRDEASARRLAVPALLVVVVFGLLSRWFELRASLYQGLVPDADTAFVIIGNMRHAYDTSTREPLWIWLGRGFVALAGGDRIGLPLLSTFFSVLCIPLVYLFASRYTASRVVGLVAAAFLAGNEFFVRACSQGHRTELLVAGVTLFAFFVFVPGVGPRRRGIGLAVAGTAAALTNIGTLAVVLPMGLWAAVKFKLGWRGLALIGATLTVFLAPHLVYNFKTFGDPFYFTRQLIPTFFRNYEFMVLKKVQCQGCPSPQELARSSYSGTRITMSEYVFGMHTPGEVIGRIVEGYGRVYLRRSGELAVLLGRRSADGGAAVALYVLYLVGLGMLLVGGHRELLLLPLLWLNIGAFLVPLGVDPRLVTPPIVFACLAMALPFGWSLKASRLAFGRARAMLAARRRLA